MSTNLGRGQTEAIAQIERRSREQSADTNRQLTALSTRLEAIAAELNRVSARLDDLSRRARAREPAVERESSADVRRIGSCSAADQRARVRRPRRTQRPRDALLRRAPSVPTAPAIPPVVGPHSRHRRRRPLLHRDRARRHPHHPAAQPAGATAEESYQAAYLDFSRGRYELALSGFRDFLRRYPDSPLADSAQYGIGESYYSMATAATTQGQTDKATRALEQAVQEFRKVIVIYPRGSKVPSALYKEALSLTELKQTALARARLQYLVDHFPQSEEAPLAKERLAALK